MIGMYSLKLYLPNDNLPVTIGNGSVPSFLSITASVKFSINTPFGNFIPANTFSYILSLSTVFVCSFKIHCSILTLLRSPNLLIIKSFCSSVSNLFFFNICN